MIARILFLSIFMISAVGLSDVRLSGEIRGLKGKGPVIIALFTPDTWGKQPYKVLRIEPERFVNGGVTYSVTVPAGDYGLTAFEDLNRNNKLDFTFFFPNEPAGFSRDFRPMGPPSFNDFKVKIDKDTSSVNVTVK